MPIVRGRLRGRRDQHKDSAGLILLRRWRGIALDQAGDTFRERGVVDHIEQSTAPVLTAFAVARYRTLLVHIAKDRVVLAACRRNSEFGVIEVGTQSSGEAEFVFLPHTRRRDFNGAGLAEGVVPALDLGILLG